MYHHDGPSGTPNSRFDRKLQHDFACFRALAAMLMIGTHHIRRTRLPRSGPGYPASNVAIIDQYPPMDRMKIDVSAQGSKCLLVPTKTIATRCIVFQEPVLFSRILGWPDRNRQLVTTNSHVAIQKKTATHASSQLSTDMRGVLPWK